MHRLALKVGVWDVDALMGAMPAGLLERWMRFYEVEPWGFDADFLLHGRMAAAIINNIPLRGDRPHFFTAADLAPDPARTREKARGGRNRESAAPPPIDLAELGTASGLDVRNLRG